MRELAKELGIPIATFQKWVEKDPTLGVYVDDRSGGSWWIKLDKFATRHGMTLQDAYLLGSRRWVRAVDLAAVSGIPRRSLARRCRDRPGFGKRLGRVYYIDLEEFGASEEQLEKLQQRLHQMFPHRYPGPSRDEE